MIWATVSSWSCFWDFSILGCKEYNQFVFSVDHLVMSMYTVFSHIVGKGCLIWPVRSLGKTLLPFALLLQGQILPVTPGISWLLTFAFQSPIMKRTSFGGVSSRRSCRSFHRTFQLQLLQHYWFGHRLGLLWYWMVCLWNEERSFCRFWDCIQVLNFRLFCWLWWLCHFIQEILAHSSKYNGNLS